MTRSLIVVLFALMGGVAAASCRPGGGGMQMGPPKNEVIRTDERPPSEIDPELHVVLPPVDSASGAASASASGEPTPIGTTVLTGPTSSASHAGHDGMEMPAPSESASASAKPAPPPKPPAPPPKPKPPSPPPPKPTPTMPPMDHSKM